ncbi:TPA: cell division protein FtsZ [Candidatus Poribacteria bacterium]|nr:cell division protein FtsZ [Candidatus Poribacteria bacterium]
MSEKEKNERPQAEGMAIIKVIGVGGGGGNAIKQMIEAGLHGVQFYAVNTDLQALRLCNGAEQVQIGAALTNGLGAGSDPNLGRRAAEEDKDKLEEIVIGSDMVFVTAGMGGGTGTGAAPLIARLAKDADILTIGVVTKPFEFEGRRRIAQADKGLEELKAYSDSVIVIPNQRLLDQVERQTPIKEAFRMADNVLFNGVKGISDLITVPGEINLDFADVRTTMYETGRALMGVGIASGANRAEIAAKSAISCPLLDETSIEGATGILVNFTGGSTMTLHEVQQAMDIIRESADSEADIIFGLVYDDDINEEIKVTLIATGFDQVWRDGVKSIAGDDVFDINKILGKSFERIPSRPVRQREIQLGPEERQNSEQKAEFDDAKEVPLDVPTYLRFGKQKRRKK